MLCRQMSRGEEARYFDDIDCDTPDVTVLDLSLISLGRDQMYAVGQ